MPFVKGRSGNPGGRKKIDKALQSRCKTFLQRKGQAELEWLALQRKDLGPKLGALRELLDRAYGRVPQPVTGEEDGPLHIRVSYADR